MDHEGRTLSAAARARMLSLPREPLLVADWLNVVMVHLEVEPAALQAVTPFALDLWEGRAFLTLVAFSLRNLRPRHGGWLGAMVFRPLAAHEFLNVRTYVRHGCEPGIHFLAEWLNSRLAVRLGPRVFSLPYRLGSIDYENQAGRDRWRGRVADAGNGGVLAYWARPETVAQQPCETGSLDEWLMERYSAFNGREGRFRFFRVWHEPWPQVPVAVRVEDRSLLAREWPFLADAEVMGGNYSPGVRHVWMGWPHAVPFAPTKACCARVVG